MANADRIAASIDRPLLGASIGVWRSDTLLAIKRANPPFQGCWTFPGGTVESGETVEAAVLRELFEETGARAQVTGICGLLDVMGRDESGGLEHHFVVIIHAGRFTGGDVHAGDGTAEVAWLTPEEMLARPTTPDFDKAVAMVTKHMGE